MLLQVCIATDLQARAVQSSLSNSDIRVEKPPYIERMVDIEIEKALDELQFSVSHYANEGSDEFNDEEKKWFYKSLPRITVRLHPKER